MSFNVVAQTWTTIYGTNYNTPPHGFLRAGNGWRPGNRLFKVNPYDNSIWIAFDTIAHGFDENGDYFRFGASNEPLFQANQNFSTILDFDFMPTTTFLIDVYNGILAYDGVNWSQLNTTLDVNDICIDGDTAWFGYQGNNPYLYWDGSVMTAGTFNYAQRLVSRNGVKWKSGSYESGSIGRLVNDVPITYSPDTSILMDNKNYDFKFAKLTDTLYTSGDLGLSLAYNDAFIDSICPSNSTNMPIAPIREFEFDQYDNIWALFGSDYSNHSHIAYYDQATKNWSQIYDNSNSPIDWTQSRLSIEVDSAGNLYVLDAYNLHILKVNNWPQWLETEEIHNENISVFPNPTTGLITVNTPEGIVIELAEIVDLSGRVLQQMAFQENLVVNVASGTYVLRLLNKEKVVYSERLIIK